MFYRTGDIHRLFGRILQFIENEKTSKEDVLVVLGDAGINYYEDDSDKNVKMMLSKWPITFFCIHGNHEQRPYRISTYKEIVWHGGIVYQEEDYPNILFAKDGEVYDFDGKKVLVIGGAYSVDKDYRIHNFLPYFSEEQPDDTIKQRVVETLDKYNWEVDIVLSHTTPYKYMPKEAFLPGINQNMVDKKTEYWLDDIEEKLAYDKWYCGHFHIEKQKDKIEFMFTNIKKFNE